jgi:predicted GIY-YIG superfamily endonuclease
MCLVSQIQTHTKNAAIQQEQTFKKWQLKLSRRLYSGKKYNDSTKMEMEKSSS